MRGGGARELFRVAPNVASGVERQHRAREWPRHRVVGRNRRGLAGIAGIGFDRQRDCDRTARRHGAADFLFHIVRELARAGLGEVHAVGGAQAAGLTVEVRALLHEAATLVDEAVPHVDVGDAGLLGAGAEQVIEIDHVAG